MKKRLKKFFIACPENNFKPKLFSSDFLFTFLVVVFALRIAFLPFYIPFSKSFFFSEVISSEILHLLNQDRRAEGLGSLEKSEKLSRAAELKARDMLEKNYFAHKSPEGVTGWYFLEMVGYDYQVAGENLAIGFLDSAEVHKAWTNSPLHKRNILDQRFEEVGVGVLTGEFEGKTTTVVVQLFATPQESRSVLAVAETEEPVEKTAGAVNTPVLEEELNTPQDAVLEKGQMLVEESPAQEAGGSVEEKLLIEAREKQNTFTQSEKAITSFFVKRYNEIAQKTVLGLSGFIGFFLALNLGAVVFRPLERKLKMRLVRHLVFEGGGGLLILLFLGAIDKVFIIQLIPHVMRI